MHHVNSECFYTCRDAVLAAVHVEAEDVQLLVCVASLGNHAAGLISNVCAGIA